MPVLSGRINSIPFSTTSNFCFPKIPMKYSKNGQNFAMSKNTSDMLFKTCWTPCKKPHFSTWSRSSYTFFWITPYHILKLRQKTSNPVLTATFYFPGSDFIKYYFSIGKKDTDQLKLDHTSCLIFIISLFGHLFQEKR